MENENLEVTAVEEPTAYESDLSPAQMFYNDLVDAAEVGSEYEEEPMSNEEVVTEGAPMEVALDVEATPYEVAVEEPQPQMATLNDVEDAKNTIMSEILKMAARESFANAPEPAQAPVEEAPQPTKEELLNRYYDNPLETIEELAESKANEKLQGVMTQLQPLLEQSKAAQKRDSITRVITDFMGNVPDARDFMDDIVPYIKGNGLDPNDPRSFVDAYRDIKLGRQANTIDDLMARANQGRSLDDYLGDEEALAQILDNENVKAKVIENYLKGIQNGAKPQTISSGGSVQAVGTAPNAPKSFTEAANLFKASL